MRPDDIRFESIKEDRDWYYVEYKPPMSEYRFSILQISVVEAKDISTVASVMEKEACEWLARYPVPLMVTAFTIEGDVMPLEDIRPIDHLIAWSNPSDTKPILRWKLVSDSELPDIALNRNFLKELFAHVPSKTGRELQLAADKRVAALRTGWWLVFAWAVIVPLGIAVLEWWSDWLGIVVLVYAIFKAVVAALRLSGKLPESKRQIEKEKEDLKMRHHHYHCELNPDGFLRLKVENFRRQDIERTKAEAASLKVDRSIHSK